MGFLRRRLGKELTAADVTAQLDLLGFKTKAEGETLHITAPTWRSTGDISMPDDILEEVARLMGYENFEFKAPTVVLDKAINQKKPELEGGYANTSPSAATCRRYSHIPGSRTNI